eukprot:2612293-Rhodomonas_salina.2
MECKAKRIRTFLGYNRMIVLHGAGHLRCTPVRRSVGSSRIVGRRCLRANNLKILEWQSTCEYRSMCSWQGIHGEGTFGCGISCGYSPGGRGDVSTGVRAGGAHGEVNQNLAAQPPGTAARIGPP